MASELQVTTIRGVPTGSNANEIVIGSGQTLDVSGATLAPSPGQVIQTATNRLDPGIDLNADLSTTSSSYIDLVGNVSSKTLNVTMNNVKSTSIIRITYYAGMISANGTWGQYNFYESTSNTYLMNTTQQPGANNPYVGALWSTSALNGGWSLEAISKPGQFSGNCVFYPRLRKEPNTTPFYWHWHSSRTPHFFIVEEIAQ